PGDIGCPKDGVLLFLVVRLTISSRPFNSEYPFNLLNTIRVRIKWGDGEDGTQRLDPLCDRSAYVERLHTHCSDRFDLLSLGHAEPVCELGAVHTQHGPDIQPNARARASL